MRFNKYDNIYTFTNPFLHEVIFIKKDNKDFKKILLEIKLKANKSYNHVSNDRIKDYAVIDFE